MTGLIKMVRGIVKHKNGMIRREREKIAALECSNRILSAYIALLASEKELRINASDVSDIIGRYRAEVTRADNCYVIKLIKAEKFADGKREASGSR